MARRTGWACGTHRTYEATFAHVSGGSGGSDGARGSIVTRRTRGTGRAGGTVGTRWTSVSYGAN